MTGFIIGIVVGIVLTLILEVITIRSTMVIVESSRFEFDETLEKLEEAVAEADWKVAESALLNDHLGTDGVDLKQRVHLLRLYKAEYAEEILRDNRHMACLMPCTVAVYETEDGSVEISKMNTKTIANILGGAVAQVMGKKAAGDEEKILQSIRKQQGH